MTLAHRSSAHSLREKVSFYEENVKEWRTFSFLIWAWRNAVNKTIHIRQKRTVPLPQEWSHWQCWRAFGSLQGSYPWSYLQRFCSQHRCGSVNIIGNKNWECNSQKGFDVKVIGSQDYLEEHFLINRDEFLIPFADIRCAFTCLVLVLFSICGRERFATMMLAVLKNLLWQWHQQTRWGGQRALSTSVGNMCLLSSGR